MSEPFQSFVTYFCMHNIDGPDQKLTFLLLRNWKYIKPGCVFAPTPVTEFLDAFMNFDSNKHLYNMCCGFCFTKIWTIDDAYKLELLPNSEKPIFLEILMNAGMA